MDRLPRRNYIASHSISKRFISRKGATNERADEIPNPKPQVPKKLQIPSSKRRKAPLGFGAWNFFGIWDFPHMDFKLKIWRQRDAQSSGKLAEYDAPDIPAAASFLEMLDIVNEQLVLAGKDPIAFDSDCREGICGTCALTINGEAHGPDHPGAVCELYMRNDDTIF